MKKLILVAVFMVITSAVYGQDAFEITTELDANGQCINWQDITSDMSYTLNVDATKHVFFSTPDSTALDSDDLQEWYVDADVSGFYLVSFSFAAVGLVIPQGAQYRQYWFRYSKDGVLFSDSAAVVVMKPTAPGHK